MTHTKEPTTPNFEEAFKKLEELLEKMHSEQISLDESLKLYEEADRLILYCNKKLQEAEKKIEILIKNRNGELTLGENLQPKTENFSL